MNSYLYDEDIDTFIKYINVFDAYKKEDLKSRDNIFIRVLKKIFKDKQRL